MTSNWKIIQPEMATNLCTNPSIETGTTGWSTSGTNTIAQSSDYSFYGVYSLKATYQDNTTLAFFNITVLEAQHVFSAYVYIPSDWDGGAIRIVQGSFGSSTQDDTTNYQTTTTGQWTRISIIWTPAAGDLSGNIQITTASAPTAGKFIYIDAVQAEQNSYVTTYLDGSLQGCYWNGTPNASTSTRKELEATGGKLLDLADDLGFLVMEQDGTGMPPVDNIRSSLALRPGDLFEAQTIRSRSFSIVGSIIGTSPTNFHSQKGNLVSVLSPNTVKINQRSQERVLRYTGGTNDKEISAVYDGGLESGLRQGWAEQDIKLRLFAADPFFRGTGENGVVLDSNDDVTLTTLAGKQSGVWSGLGPPDASGTYTDVRALLVYNNVLYVGGNFLNFDNIANADYIVSYDISAGTYSALSTGADGIVYALAKDSSGNIYAGGAFANIGGSAYANIAVWDGSTWSDINGETNTGTVYAIYIDNAGNLYVGGNFTNWDTTGANYIAKFDGANWSSMGTDPNGIVRAITSDSAGNIYIGGDFTTAGGNTVNYVSVYTGSDWQVLGSGMNSSVYALQFNSAGSLYATGDFSTADGNSAAGIAYWNGYTWLPLGGGINGNGRALGIYGDLIYAGGAITGAGDLDFIDAISIWNGSTWVPLDFNHLTSIIVYAIAVDQNGDLYIGTDEDSVAQVGGSTTVTYTGTERSYPTIKISWTGGTSAKLISIANETTGAQLYFNYDLLLNEVLTIDTRPAYQSVVSNFRGNVYSSLLPNSDFGQFYLLHGNSGSLDNVITMYANESNDDIVVTATMTYKTVYISEDD